jgi:ACS family hexuronate transporter-like MFS transporter
MAHGLARTVTGFGLARFGLGLAEGGNFPGAIKSVGEWFPRRERALATGIFNAGSNVGALITPIAVPWITIRYGWPAAFYVTGAVGFVWLAAWWILYRSPESHPRVTPAELAHIRSDPPDPPARIPWLSLLRHRQTWAFAVAMFLVSPVWWFYLYWIPGFLRDRYALDLVSVGWPLVTIYLMTDVGSIGGGWLSSSLLKRGWSVNAARKTALLACALCVVPIIAASQIGGLWPATLLIGLAASAHQGFSANLYTLVSDTVPRQAVSSVVGIGGMAGAVGGMFIAQLTGYVLKATGSYVVPFAIAGCAYLVALAVVHLMLPRLEPMRLDATRER